MTQEIFLNIPAPALEEIVVELRGRGRRWAAVCAAGLFVTGSCVRLVHRATAITRHPQRAVRDVAESGLCPVVALSADRQPNRTTMLPYVRTFARVGADRGAAVAIINQGSSLQVFGWMRHGDRFFPIDVFTVPGPGMLSASVGSLWPLPRNRATRAAAASPEQRQGAEAHQGHDDVDLSRLAAFVGRGDRRRGSEVLRRARRLKIVVVGCGRMGSSVALRLVKCGVGSEGWIILVDADIVEAWNLDVTPLPPDEVGNAKVEAVAREARRLNPHCTVVPLLASISDKVVADAIALADLLVTCVDRNSARLGGAVLARRSGCPHFDVTGGAAYTRNGDAAWGGELRLSLPGLLNCVACMGEYDWETALRELSASPEEERRQRRNNDWLRERPGSSGAMISAVLSEAEQKFWALMRGEQPSRFGFTSARTVPGLFGMTGRNKPVAGTAGSADREA